MVFYAAFNSISVISRRQVTLLMSFLGFISTRLGSEVSCPRTLPRKTQRIQYDSNPGLRVKHRTTKPRRTPWKYISLNSLRNDKILAMSKLKAIADDKLIEAKTMISLLDWVENIVGKGENAGYQGRLR